MGLNNLYNDALAIAGVGEDAAGIQIGDKIRKHHRPDLIRLVNGDRGHTAILLLLKGKPHGLLYQTEIQGPWMLMHCTTAFPPPTNISLPSIDAALAELLRPIVRSVMLMRAGNPT